MKPKTTDAQKSHKTRAKGNIVFKVICTQEDKDRVVAGLVAIARRGKPFSTASVKESEKDGDASVHKEK